LISIVSISCFQSRFYHIAYIDFARIAASNTAADVRSHIESLIQTYTITVLILYSKFVEKFSITDSFNTIYDDSRQWFTFLPTLCI